ncbi:hypothetical protein ABW19_dt0208450 [Dactylella cylindrospora]|nr:hypothetical protein ABW19_dt0208450 [Dactylella cylindrospora]
MGSLSPFAKTTFRQERKPSPTDIAISKRIQSTNPSNCDLYGEDGFWVVDLDVIRSQLSRWQKNLPLVRPFYAVKCNPTPQLLSLLSSFSNPSHPSTLNVGFDCATHSEISTLLSLSVPPENIIYANPCKAPSHLRYASTVGVRKMTFDNAAELYKIREFFPDAECVIRIKTEGEPIEDDNSGTGEEGKVLEKSAARYQLSLKYGVSPNSSRALLNLAKSLNLSVTGVAFHVGSAQSDPNAYLQGIVAAKKVWRIAAEVGYTFKLLDIGGGFMDENFERAAEKIGFGLDREFGELIRSGEVEVIAEPGRYICASAFTLATSVIAVREETEGEGGRRMLYLADGMYSNINAAMWPRELSFPEIVKGRRLARAGGMETEAEGTKARGTGSSASSDSGIEVEERGIGSDVVENEVVGEWMEGEYQEYTVWGPTCDCGDVILKSAWLPKGIEVGDWFVFRDLGAYSTCMRNPFNGFATKNKFYVLDELSGTDPSDVIGIVQ